MPEICMSYMVTINYHKFERNPSSGCVLIAKVSCECTVNAEHVRETIRFIDQKCVLT